MFSTSKPQQLPSDTVRAVPMVRYGTENLTLEDDVEDRRVLLSVHILKFKILLIKQVLYDAGISHIVPHSMFSSCFSFSFFCSMFNSCSSFCKNEGIFWGSFDGGREGQETTGSKLGHRTFPKEEEIEAVAIASIETKVSLGLGSSCSGNMVHVIGSHPI